MSELLQDGRIGELTTPSGTFVLSRFEGTEALGQLFEFRIGAVLNTPDFDFNALIGKNCNVTVIAADKLKRHFNGVLVDGGYTGGGFGLYHYQFVLRPWLHLLSRASDCRIFKDKNVIDIIKKVFDGRGFSDYRDDTTGSYPQGTYVTQYRETDLNFVSRLMEEWGIYYYFEHAKDKHTMVLCDGPGCHKTIPGLQPVPLLPSNQDARRDRQQFDSWSTARAFQNGKDAINSYWPKKPTADYLGKADMSGDYTHSDLETYDYDTTFKAKNWSERYSKVRLESVQALDNHRIAIGSAPSLTPGYKFTHSDNKSAADNKEYLVLRCTHSLIDQTYVSGGAAQTAYAGTYEMMDGSRQYRSLMTTRRTNVGGYQSALVVADKGNESEEIEVDKPGWILLKFYWDREKTITRRVRVVQFWAGSTRGSWFVPRVGDEVIVAYEDGDPDMPLVIGSVYNNDNPVPTTLPSRKTHSGILTKSSKNSDGYHMLMFDDTVNAERIKLRSQRDLMFKALRNEQRDILYDQTENIGKDETINVGLDMANDMQKGGGNWTLNAFKTANIHVGPKEMPMTHLVMTQQDITLSVGPKEMPMTQIKMTMSDITIQVGPEGLMSKITLSMTGIQHAVMAGLTNTNWSPASISALSPTISLTAMASITLTAAAGVQALSNLQTPALIAGGAVVGGIPI